MPGRLQKYTPVAANPLPAITFQPVPTVVPEPAAAAAATGE